MRPWFDSRSRHHMWVEFVVGSRPCPERFFSVYSSFPLSSKTTISKFQFDLDYCLALYHEPLARETVQALPVLLTLNKLLTLLLTCLRIGTTVFFWWTFCLSVNACSFFVVSHQIKNFDCTVENLSRPLLYNGHVFLSKLVIHSHKSCNYKLPQKGHGPL